MSGSGFGHRPGFFSPPQGCFFLVAAPPKFQMVKSSFKLTFITLRRFRNGDNYVHFPVSMSEQFVKLICHTGKNLAMHRLLLGTGPFIS